MMKKESADWNIAATHYLTAGFAIPLLIMLLTGLILGFAGVADGLITTWISVIVGWVAIWFGVRYSASFLRKKYVVLDSAKIARLSVIYMIVIVGGLLSLVLFLAMTQPNVVFDVIKYGTNVFTSVISIILFNVASHKYITQDATPEGSSVSPGPSAILR